MGKPKTNKFGTEFA